jgi:hypothetical protein
MNQDNQEPDGSVDNDAIVTPPAMTMLLSVAVKPKEAHASTILGGGWGGRPRPRLLPRLPILPRPPR